MASTTIQDVGHVLEVEMDEETASIDILPDECLLSIFEYLCQKDLFTLTLVSKRCNSVTDRLFRLQIANKTIEIKQLPSLTLLQFGSSVRHLKLLSILTEEGMEAIFKLCPNLIGLSLKGIFVAASSKPFFHKMMSQLHELDIQEMSKFPLTPRFPNNFQATLQNCKNLMKLTLGNFTYVPTSALSNFEPFFQVVFPKLHHFEVNLDQSLSNQLFSQFLQSNGSIKSLVIESNRRGTDLRGILSLRQLERLFLSSLEPTSMHSIIPYLYQLDGLKYLELRMDGTRRDIIEDLFKSLKNCNAFPNLTEMHIVLNVVDMHKHTTLVDIRDEDLIRLKYLPKLALFKVSSYGRCTNVTLPGILNVLKYCPNLTEFYIYGFRQNYSPDGINLVDNDLYEEFRRAYFNMTICDYKTKYNCKWFHFFTTINMIDLWKGDLNRKHASCYL